MAYGYDGNCSAIDWLIELGEIALTSMSEADKERLQTAGILSKDGTIVQEQLVLAQKYKYVEGQHHVN